MKEFKEGYVLQENEYLARFGANKVPEKEDETDYSFLTKYTLKGEIPKAFLSWRNQWNAHKVVKIFIHTEEFKSGWKFLRGRFGESQNWAVLVHPNNFLIEVYLDDFFELLETTTMINCELQGKFKWHDKKLIKEF